MPPHISGCSTAIDSSQSPEGCSGQERQSGAVRRLCAARHQPETWRRALYHCGLDFARLRAPASKARLFADTVLQSLGICSGECQTPQTNRLATRQRHRRESRIDRLLDLVRPRCDPPCRNVRRGSRSHRLSQFAQLRFHESSAIALPRCIRVIRRQRATRCSFPASPRESNSSRISAQFQRLRSEHRAPWPG